MAKLKFVGRHKEIKDFKKFIHSEAKRVLLIIGKQEIGKTRLLEQFELECYKLRDIEPLVYSYQIKGTDPPKQYLYQIMDEIWMRKNVFARIIDKKGEIIRKSIGSIPGFGKILKNITESIFRDPRRPVTDRFKIFLQEIVEGFKKKNQRFVLFIDPLDELTRGIHKDAWRAITQSLPYQVKIIIGQREKDVLAKCIELTDHEDVDSWTLDCLSDKDTKDLVKSELAYVQPSVKFVDEFAKRYKGYPLFIDGAIKLIRKQRELTPEALKKLSAPKLTKLLYDKLGEDERNLISHLSILEVPVDMPFLRDFTRIKKWKLDGLLRRDNVKDVVKAEENGKRTYQIYHQTFKDFVLREMDNTDVDILAFHKKASKTFLKILEKDPADVYALRYSTAHLIWAGEWKKYAETVVKRLDKIDNRIVRGNVYVTFLWNLGVGLVEMMNWIQMCLEGKLTTDLQATILSNLGSAMLAGGRLESALTYFKEAVEIYKKLAISKEIGDNLLYLASTYEKKKELRKALTYSQQSLSYYEKEGFEKGISHAKTFFQKIKKRIEEESKN